MNTVPSWEDFNIFVLKALNSGTVFALRDLRRAVLSLAQLDAAQRSVALANGDSMAENRIGWSISYLNRVDAIDRPARTVLHHRKRPRVAAFAPSRDRGKGSAITRKT
jgi:restriction system protein